MHDDAGRVMRRVFVVSHEPVTLREKLYRLLVGCGEARSQSQARDGGLREHGGGGTSVVPNRIDEHSVKVVR